MKLPLAVLLCASTVLGSSPAFWEMSTFSDFLKGRLQSVSLSRSGALSVAPKLDPVFSSGEAYIWSIAQAPNGTIYAGTGNRGRLWQINASGQGTVVWTAPQSQIFAVAVDAKGVVYAGTSPSGKVFRIENGKATEYFDPKSTYIWALAVASDGTLFVGTGGEGKVFRVTGAGQGEEYYASDQANITGLAFDAQGRLLAGSEPNGILYRITAKNKAFVLYDANLPEIRAMASDPDGSVYVVGLGGSIAHKTQSAAQGATTTVTDVPTVTTSITVTASAQAGGDMKTPAVDPNKLQPATPTPATASATAAPVEVTGVEKSAIYKIHPDNTVETLWSSKEENVYDVLSLQGSLLFSTDTSGRIYRLTGDRKLTLVAETNQGEVTRLFRSQGAVLASTGTGGRVFRLSDAEAPQGNYESPPFDTGSVSRWGKIHWQGKGKPIIRTRTGNSLRPDRTWSEWSPPMTASEGVQIASPNARYIVWKAELPPASTLETVSVAYQVQNNPPAVRSITALTTVQAVSATSKSTGSTSAAATAPYTMTVTDTGDAGITASTGTPTQTLSRAGQQQLTLSWQADDPDGDKLVYSVAFQGEGERDWKTLRRDLHENTLTLDGDALADGRYLFRVMASDQEVNPGNTAREAELVSSPVLIDNTPPVITIGKTQNSAVDFEAADTGSPLKRCEYAIDGGPWVPLAPAEGILDSRTARFHLSLPSQLTGEHLLVLRVYDSGNNAGLAKVVLH